MINKKGFTLAEVLITLGIIGVISAIAMPNFIINTTRQQIPPKLKKFISCIQEANHLLIEDQDVNLVSEAASSGSDYVIKILPLLKGRAAQENGSLLALWKVAKIYDMSGEQYKGWDSMNVIHLDDGTDFGIMYSFLLENNVNSLNSYKGLVGFILFDINGLAQEPNKIGKDIFMFILDDSGAVVPYGGKEHLLVLDSPDMDMSKWQNSWQNKCKNNETPTNANSCAGAIADNGWEVKYKFK